MKEKYRICLFNLFLEPSLDWFKEETLCLNISNGICLLEAKCNLKHPNYDGKPYLWQYFYRNSTWFGFDEFINDKIESSFRDQNSNECNVE